MTWIPRIAREGQFGRDKVARREISTIDELEE